MSNTLGAFDAPKETEVIGLGLEMSFTPFGTIDFPINASVALSAEGIVNSPSSHEESIGYVIGKPSSGDVLVRTNFMRVVNAQAKGAVNVGDLVLEDFADSIANERLTMEIASPTNYAIGRALNAAADCETIEVGLFYSPIIKS